MPAQMREWLAPAWPASYRSQVPGSLPSEFDDVAAFLSGQASEAGAAQADRMIAARGLSRPGRGQRDASCQRGCPWPEGRAERPLDKGHVVAHGAGGEPGPGIFPQDRALNRGWPAEGKRYRAVEREIAATRGAFFSCCLPHAGGSGFPAAAGPGLLRPAGLHVKRFRDRFGLQ